MRRCQYPATECAHVDLPSANLLEPRQMNNDGRVVTRDPYAVQSSISGNVFGRIICDG